MSLTDAILTEPIKEKLRNLREYIPNQESVLYQFGGLLAERLGGHPTINPIGFNLVAQLTLHDLETGVSPGQSFPIKQSLVGYPTLIYAILRTQIPVIAKATCPEDFAQGIKEFYDEVNSKAKEETKID